MIVIEKYATGEVSINVPFDHDFVADLKRAVPRHLRRWSREDRSWIISTSMFHVAHEILERYFGNESWRVSEEAQIEVNRAYGNKATCSSNGTPYDYLYLKEDAPDCVLVAAYRALSREHHPDIGGNRDTMAAINMAYERIKAMRGL